MSELRKAAQAVVDRWDSPDWSDGTHTIDYINRLRRAIVTDQEQFSEVANIIDYPECWDTMAYPTIADALCELLTRS